MSRDICPRCGHPSAEREDRHNRLFGYDRLPTAVMEDAIGLCWATGDADCDDRVAARDRDIRQAAMFLGLLGYVLEIAILRYGRIEWQCSGCHWGFRGSHPRTTCPECKRQYYWTGSVHPDAKLWPGYADGRVKP